MGYIDIEASPLAILNYGSRRQEEVVLPGKFRGISRTRFTGWIDYEGGSLAFDPSTPVCVRGRRASGFYFSVEKYP